LMLCSLGMVPLLPVWEPALKTRRRASVFPCGVHVALKLGCVAVEASFMLRGWLTLRPRPRHHNGSGFDRSGVVLGHALGV
jgi:hypothetical protein